MEKYMHESDFESIVIDMIQNLGYEYYYGADIRKDYPSMNSTRNVVITEILYKALKKINPDAHDKAIDEAIRLITNLSEIHYIDKNKIKNIFYSELKLIILIMKINLLI